MNATVAMRFTSTAGQVVLALLVFASLAAGISAVSSDIFSRSSQAVSNLRSIGATSRSLTSALAFPVFGYSLAGSALGAGLGVALGFSLGPAAGPSVTFLDVLAVIAVASAASVAGVYAGGRAAWRS